MPRRDQRKVRASEKRARAQVRERVRVVKVVVLKAKVHPAAPMVGTRAGIQMISYPLLQISPVQIGTFLTR